jgi:hypothetical protein
MVNLQSQIREFADKKTAYYEVQLYFVSNLSKWYLNADKIDLNCIFLQLFAAFRSAELGSWVKKPMEQDEFQILEDLF